MQAVILAAGKSTRTYPLTLTRPKPLLEIAGRAIILHTLDCLVGIANEAIIIVGYMAGQIRGFLGNNYRGIRIKYVFQKYRLGTGHALLMAKKYVKGRFIMLAGDDIYLKSDIKRCLRHDYAVLTSTTKSPQNFGVIIEKSNVLVDFVEKPKKFISSTINTSLYVLDAEIFRHLKQVKKSARGEIELPDAIKLVSKNKEIACVMAKRWIPIGYPWDVIKADLMLRHGKSRIARGAKIHGKVVNSSIGKNCIIYGNVQNSVILEGTIIEKGSVVKNSIIGSHASFSGKINSAPLKFGKKSGMNFGAAIGDDAVLDNVVIMPGVKISPKTYIKNRKIKNDV